MAKTIILIAVAVVVGIGAYYFIATSGSRGIPAHIPAAPSTVNTNAPTPTAQPSVTPTPATSISDITQKTPAPLNLTVTIKNFSFSSPALTIKAGTTVTWINNDAVSHTVTSDAGNLLDSPILAPGQSFHFTFTASGAVHYHCAIHPSMKGSIIVAN